MELKDAYFDLKAKEILDKKYSEGDISTEVYEEELQGLEGAEERFAECYAGEESEELVVLVKEARDMGNLMQEITEAEDAARSVLYCAREVEKEASSAQGWGIFDLLGGGLISSAIKYGKVADTKSCANDMKRAIDRLNVELNDIKELYKPMDDMGEKLLLGADILFDNFFIDIYTLGKISNMKEEAVTVRERTAVLLSKLEGSFEEMDLKQRLIEDKIRGY